MADVIKLKTHLKYKIQRVIIYVSDPIRFATFYQKNFSLPATDKWTDQWAEVDAGGCKIGFHQAYNIKETIKTPTGSPDNPHKISFLVDDVVEARLRLVKAGVQMSDIKTFEAWSICTGYDCEGHAFQLTNR